MRRGALIDFEGGLIEETAGTMRTNYMFNGQAVAVREPGAATVSYLHGDQLGSISLTTGAGGAVLTRQEFDPWGKIRSGGVTQTKRNFTGQYLDGTGLLYDNARYYDPNLGRFISADSIVPGNASGGMDGIALKPLTVSFSEPGFTAKLNSENQFGPWFTLSDTEKQQIGSPMGPQNPQALNRYSYVLNNPMRYTDPSGHMPPDVVLCTFDAACRERVWHSVVSLVDTAVFVTVRLFGGDVAYYGDKIANQMPKRGWSEEDMRQTLSHPADTAKTINKATGNSATKYYNSEGQYIVRDDVTDEIIQVSNRNDSHWIDDLTNQPIKPRQ